MTHTNRSLDYTHFFNLSFFVFGCFCTSHENKAMRYILFLSLIAFAVLFISGELLCSL